MGRHKAALPRRHKLFVAAAGLWLLNAVAAVAAGDFTESSVDTGPVAHPDAAQNGLVKVPDSGALFSSRPLTEAEIDARLDAIVWDNVTATSIFRMEKPAVDDVGDKILMLITVRVYTSDIMQHMRRYLAAHMQGMHAIEAQTSLLAKYRFANHFSSFEGSEASPEYQAVAKQFHMEEFSAFDFTFTYGTAKGNALQDPLTRAYLSLITRTVAAYVTQAGFHRRETVFPSIAVEYPLNYYSAEQFITSSWYIQGMKFDLQLLGQDLLPFIPERQTAAMLAFRDAFQAENATLRTFNVRLAASKPQRSGHRHLLVSPAEDVVHIAFDALVAPVDWYTPRQAMDAVLRDGTFQTAVAKYGMPIRAVRLLGASMETTKVTDKGRQVRVTGIDDISGFDAPSMVAGPAAALRRAKVASRHNRHVGATVTAAIAVAFLLLGALAGILTVARRVAFWQGYASSLGNSSRDSSNASLHSKSSGVQSSRSSSASQRIRALLRRSSAPAEEGEEMEPLARDAGKEVGSPLEAGEEVRLCTDAEGNPVVLGRGSWGHIYLATRWGTQEVAVKVIDREGHAASWLGLLRREVAMLRRISFDRNIVQFYGACLEGDHAMLIMEYCAGGDLRRALQSERGPELAWYRGGRAVALDVARGLRFCHATGVIHRDLKSSNVLLTAEGVAKIGDVGLARLISAAEETSLAVAGTFSFAAPEMLLGRKVTEKADAYSFGVLLWEVATHEVPVRGQMRELRCPQEAPDELADLIEQCMEVEPEARPSSQQIFEALQALPEQAPEL